MVGKAGYELAFEDTFDGDDLDEARWLPYYLPQWSTREASAARYRLGDGFLRLVIEADQQPWCPEFDAETRVSSLQTGVFAGPVGSTAGQSRFKPGLVVRQAQDDARLYTPQYGLFELRAKAIDDPRCMVALWMIGYEDRPDRSAEICIPCSSCSASTSSPTTGRRRNRRIRIRRSSSSTTSAATGPPHRNGPDGRPHSCGGGRWPSSRCQ